LKRSYINMILLPVIVLELFAASYLNSTIAHSIGYPL
jgi:hypothetical protein